MATYLRGPPIHTLVASAMATHATDRSARKDRPAGHPPNSCPNLLTPLRDASKSGPELPCSGIAILAIAGAEVGFSVLSANPLVPTASVGLLAIAGAETHCGKSGAPTAWLPHRWRSWGRAIVVMALAPAVVTGVAPWRAIPMVWTPGTT